ncbi:MAG: dephospho-CoA kinase [Candidatus Epulonipiscioides saccharophilum]|nr:MAG: dephospho-CoA kinase [Epulopiscium sp. AS2M-Bin001]
MIIGIVGGSGVGKTTVVNMIYNKTHSYIIDADKIGHELLLKNGLAYNEVVEHFGSTILDSDQNIIRKSLGNIVFQNKSELAVLNQITHPKILAQTKSILNNLDQSKYDFIIIDSALLYEIGLDSLVDLTIAVYASSDIRARRLMARNNLSYDDALARINSQKTSYKSDYSIFNESDLVQLEEQIDKFLN